MSTATNVQFLVIFLIFLIVTSTSSCNARPIQEKQSEKDEKESVARASIPGKLEQSDQPYKYATAAAAGGGERGGEEEVYNAGRKYDDVVKSKVQQGAHKEEEEGKKASLPINNSKPLQTEAGHGHGDVSWKLPQKKRSGEKQPGFNLDYAPPKTHPPSHN